ncbi:MarR family winged helix-turn-helix transcriptional regulator [Mailhella sp.]
MEYCDSVDRLNRILVRGHRIIQHELLKLGVDDLVPSHGAVLEHLKAMGMPQPVTELVTALRRPKSSITKATDCLENGGYVFKKPNPGDGRSYLVGLTPSGAEVLKLFTQAHVALEKKMYANIPAERVEECMRTLLEIESNLK